MKLLVIFLVVLPLLSQTNVKLPQISGPSGANPTVGVISPDGKLTIASIGPGISLVQNADGTFTLSATTTSTLTERTIPLTRSTDGSYTIPDIPKGEIKVFRNGILQSPVANPNVPLSSPDYTILGTIIRGTTVSAWQATDMVVVSYFK